VLKWTRRKKLLRGASRRNQNLSQKGVCKMDAKDLPNLFLFRAIEQLELAIGATDESGDLDDAHDYEIRDALDHLESLIRKKMPCHFEGAPSKERSIKIPLTTLLGLIVQAGMEIEGDNESGYGFSIRGDYEKIGVTLEDEVLTLYHPNHGADFTKFPEWPILKLITGLLDSISRLEDPLSISLRLHFLKALLKEANEISDKGGV
jgi:hypothetical protein